MAKLEELRGSVKEHSIWVVIAAVASWIPIVPFMWYVFQPFLVQEVGAAMADQIQEQIQSEVQPLGTAFEVLIQRDIAELRRQIAAMEFRKDTGSWTSQDAEDLVNLRLELESMQKALRALRNGNKSG